MLSSRIGWPMRHCASWHAFAFVFFWKRRSHVIGVFKLVCLILIETFYQSVDPNSSYHGSFGGRCSVLFIYLFLQKGDLFGVDWDYGWKEVITLLYYIVEQKIYFCTSMRFISHFFFRDFLFCLLSFIFVLLTHDSPNVIFFNSSFPILEKMKL